MGKIRETFTCSMVNTNELKNDIPTKMVRKSTVMYFFALINSNWSLFVMSGEEYICY